MNMVWLELVWVGVLGLILGSFFGVISDRYDTGKGIGGRSVCDVCGRTLAWHQLIPVLGPLIHKGACMWCGGKISWSHVGYELLTAGVFMIIWLQGFTAVEMIIVGLVASVLIVLLRIDMRLFIIPDTAHMVLWFLGWTLLFLATLGLAPNLFTDPPSLEYALGALVVPLPFLVLWVFSKGRLLGLGDVKLMAPMGLFLGAERGLLAVMVAFWLGALGVLLYVLVRRSYKSLRGKAIPFGPFLAAGFFLVLVYGVDLFDVAGIFFSIFDATLGV